MSLISSLSFLRQSPQLVGKYKEDMPQSLLITDFEGNAIMNPSLITRHTTTRHMIRDVPVELKVAAAAISDGNESRNCSFMKIPVEIRLQIYSYLLVASPSRAQLKEKASEGVILAIDRSWHKGKRLASPYYKLDKSGVNRFRIDLAPQILRTCKAIHQEATAILYGENVFYFGFRKTDSIGVSYPERDTLEALCQGLYQNAAEPWDGEVHGVFRCSEFAAFLLQIGQQNTASLKRLRFDVERASDNVGARRAGSAIQAITQVFKYHVPGLRQVKICRDVGGCRDVRSWDEFETGPSMPAYDILKNRGKESSNNNQPDFKAWRDSLLPETPIQEEAMYTAVRDMVQEIPWLKQLSFAGFDEKDSTHQKMKELQALVKTRR